jgi:hypothetical protein
MGYYDSLPPSFGSQVFSNESGAALKSFNFGTTIDSQFTSGFGVDTAGQFNSVADALTGTGALSSTSWSFITAPEDISWDIANNANRVDMFGTNNPPVVAGSRGMRDLSLSNSLVEGFIRGVNVEGKVAALENLMNYGLNASDGFVSVPVYQVWANEKSYGGPEAYYIIKDVKVKEAMRDLTGNSTRAYVDISLMQVPAYQVNSGRDQASATTSGAKSGLLSQAQVNAAQQATATAAGAQATSTKPQAAGAKPQAASTAAANQGVGTSKPAAGAGAAQPPKPNRNPAASADLSGNRLPSFNLNID